MSAENQKSTAAEVLVRLKRFTLLQNKIIIVKSIFQCYCTINFNSKLIPLHP